MEKKQSFNSFVREYISSYVQYFKIFDSEDIIFVDVKQSDNYDMVIVMLEADKGYGDNHYYTKNYDYELDRIGLYNCTNVNHLCGYYEGELVRKLMSAYEKYYGRKKHKVTIRIEQELD